MGAIVDLGFLPHLHVDDYTKIPCLLKESSSYIGHVFFGMGGNTRANYQKKTLKLRNEESTEKEHIKYHTMTAFILSLFVLSTE